MSRAVLYLKPANFEDAEAEYDYVAKLPEDENGFTNDFHGISRKDFEETALPQMINWSNGVGLPEGFVPETFFFLWREEPDGGRHIVGQFRLRHHLVPALRDGAGHVGYHIAPEHRGKGFASEGLRLLIPLAREILARHGENELYLRCDISNHASLAVMQRNGAAIHHRDETKYYTRIKLRQKPTP